MNKDTRTLFLSHRGESDDAPENTLEAFQLALEWDSDGIELDLRLTADKKLVCFHDADMIRVANAALKIAEHTYDELCKYHDIPLFAEALAVLGKDKHMQIELKGSPDLLPFVRDVLDTFPGRERFAISSFETETIRMAADFFPNLPRVLLIDLQQVFNSFPDAAEVIEFLKPLKCGISFKADFKATPEFVSALHRAGLRVVCWGVSSDELGLAMARAGVDAMTCNHAVALRQKFLDLK